MGCRICEGEATVVSALYEGDEPEDDRVGHISLMLPGFARQDARS